MASYKNKNTGQIIQSKDILYDSDDSITYFDGDTWKSVSKQYLEIFNEIGTEVQIESKDDITSSDINYIENETVHNTTDNALNRFSSIFGINNIVIKSNVYKDTSVFVSKDIKISMVYSISLKANYYEGESGSIEFYIIDGIKEIPIRPISHNTIQNEKCFYGMLPRFNSDKYIFYENFKRNENIVSINDIDFSSGNTFTVNYIPSNDSDMFYTPSSSSIKIKAILRSYNSTSVPPYIKSLCIIENKNGV